jgi:Tfp pilus assembly protein FimT
VTLLEIMVVVAVLAVVAALAVPNMLPVLQRSRARAAAEDLASIVEDARRRAVSSGRCHRVVLAGAAATIERRTTPDCVNISLDSWVTVRTTTVPGFTLSVERVPGSVSAANALIFRPNSRLRGDNDLRIDDDGARLLAALPGGFTATVSVMANGRLCTAVLNAAPPALAAPPVCR